MTLHITSPLRRSVFTVLVTAFALGGLPASAQVDQEKKEKLEATGYHEFNYGQEKKDAENWIQAIRVTEPPLRSDVKGEVTVKFTAKGMERANAYCWRQPTKENPSEWGHDVNLTPDGMTLIGGRGEFTFNADDFPNGPMNVRIFANNEAGKKDIFELQLFNTGGVKWNQGAGDHIPPIVKQEGLQLIFEEDFKEGPPSISKDGQGTTFMSHKPRGGDFSGWQFTMLEDGRPFEQRGDWLRIKARKDKDSPKGRSGIIASVNHEGKGVWAKAPAYFECRFTAQSAIGTWPAFWTLTSWEDKRGTDELDIVEAYGGMGKGNPNHPGYSIVSHFWRQKNPDGSKKKGVSTRPPMMELGGKSYWSTTFHTYAVYVGLEDTVYYFDDIEVQRHPTNNVSAETPHYFLVNLAIGGISGWPIDLRRYENGTDMWIDYVRVFAKEKTDYKPYSERHTATEGLQAVGLNFAVPGKEDSDMLPDGVAGAPHARQENWNNLQGSSGSLSDPKGADGKLVNGMTVTWKTDGDAKSGIDFAEHWGFRGNYLRLQRGALRGGGQITVTGVPYKRYRVFVFTNGGPNRGKGKIEISSDSGHVGPEPSYFYEVSWNEGKFSLSKAVNAKMAKNMNYVQFGHQRGQDFTLTWDNTWGGWTGVTGIQIVQH
ncbi:MAG: family 16 glycosylhydrolase [Verrucomicrobiota bacterium]